MYSIRTAYWMRNQSRLENIMYLALWGMLFAAPVLSLYVHTVMEPTETFRWQEVLMVWSHFAVFLSLFLVHNFFIAPLLIHERKPVVYGAIVASIVVMFTLYECSTGPVPHAKRQHPMHEMTSGERPPLPADMQPAPHGETDEGPHGEMRGPHEGPMPHDKANHRPPVFIGEHDIIAVLILLMMFGINLAIKGFFRHRNDEKKYIEMQKENLEQQLEYLKYQLNPHFLMNTLNNIHALVDIDAEQSKEAIIHLSKILRYVLYESNKERVPVSQEQEFMSNYVTLMRMRYTDKLRFTVDSPDDGRGVYIAPLVFISFVENAFKHGVSYQQESFIEIVGKRYRDKLGGERLLWTCRNSKHNRPQGSATPAQGGVGLQNVRRRLDLIYGNNYSLGVNETDTTYEVILDIPMDTHR